jgi:hypothetical protein
MAFKTRMVWRSVGAGDWDVELVQLIDGRAALLATLSLDGGVKVKEARRHAGDRHLASGDLCHEGAPLGQGSRAPLLVDLPRDEMALLIELVVDLGMN